jgi:cation transport ATPase
MADDKNKIWNEAGKAGLVLAGVAAAYFIITSLISKSGTPGIMMSVLSLILWAAKFSLCIWLMIRFLRKEAEQNGKDRSATFRFGMKIALCSALVYAAVYLFYVLFIDPDMFAQSFNMLAQSYSSYFSSDQLDQLMNMESSMPTITFFVNLLWCWLFGTIVSAIAAGSICGNDNPFEE